MDALLPQEAAPRRVELHARDLRQERELTVTRDWRGAVLAELCVGLDILAKRLPGDLLHLLYGVRFVWRGRFREVGEGEQWVPLRGLHAGRTVDGELDVLVEIQRLGPRSDGSWRVAHRQAPPFKERGQQA